MNVSNTMPITIYEKKIDQGIVSVKIVLLGKALKAALEVLRSSSILHIKYMEQSRFVCFADLKGDKFSSEDPYFIDRVIEIAQLAGLILNKNEGCLGPYCDRCQGFAFSEIYLQISSHKITS